VKNSAGNVTHYTNTFPVTSTGGTNFVYVQRRIPVTAVTAGANFIIELQGQSLTTPGGSSPGLLPVIDDVFFYPINAAALSYTYDIPYGTASVTNGNGTGIFTTYDKLGRERYVFNQDKDIIQKKTYKFAGDEVMFAADFPVPETIYATESTTFTATNNPCLSGLTYEWEWDYGTGYVSGSQAQAHTFTTAGYKQIRLKITHPVYGTKEVMKGVVVSWRPIGITICAKGVQEFNFSTGSIIAQPSCPSITATPPMYGTIFQVNSMDYTPIDECIYQWKIRDIGTTAWINVGTNSTQFTFQKVVSGTASFEVMCSVSNGTGRTGSSLPVAVIVSH
jgi:hypothetical protein